MSSDKALPATEAVSPRYAALDSWDTPSVLAALLEAQIDAAAAVRAALPALAAAGEAAAARLGIDGRLVYVGAGTSGRIAVQDGAELPPTFDWPEERLVLLMAGGEAAFTRAIEGAEDRADLAEAAIAAHGIGPRDVVIGIAASGGTPFTLAALRASRAAGALTVGVANSPDAALIEAAEHGVLVATGAEPLAGSTRLKAGTAQKIALNLFSTLVMVRLGRVWRGRMVEVQARNAKLCARAERMVAELGDVEVEAARAALAVAGGKVKTALLVLRGFGADDARALLARCGGRLGEALALSEGHGLVNRPR